VRTMKSRLLITLISAVLILGGQSILGSSAFATSSGGGYTWVQQSPFPGRDDVISSTSAISATNVWSVGGQGSAFLWDGTSLSKQWTGTTNNLYGVSALAEGAASRVWAVGQGAVIRYYNGASWVGQASPNLGYGYDLWSVSAIRLGVNSYRAWAVGTTDGFHNAIILYYDGAAWSLDENYATGQFCDVQAIYSAPNTYVWAVGSDTVNHGRVMYSTGDGNWTSRNTTYALLSLSAVNANNLYGVEWDGSVLSSEAGGRKRKKGHLTARHQFAALKTRESPIKKAPAKAL